MITFERVTKEYGGRVAVHELSLAVDAGQIAVLAGPSGCGKTTTLRMINRLTEPTSGTIFVDGQDNRRLDVNRLRRSIGYVIQQAGLFPHRTIAENVATVPELLGWERARIRRRVAELLDLVGLPAEEFGSRLPSQLSGGQRQRVGVARALGADPPVLLMDEPFGALDPVTRGNLQDELLRLQQVVRKTVVFVTHDIDEAIKIADRIAIFSPRGELAQYAPPAELLAKPASDYVDTFLGGGRLLRRLALIPLREVRLGPMAGTVPSTMVDIGGTLREALDAILGAPDGRVAIADGPGNTVGVLDLDAVRRAAQ